MRTVVVVTLLGLALTSGLVAGCGGGDEAADTEAAPATTSATTAAETEADTGAVSGNGDPAAGAAVFESAGCAGCHTLAAAGATGQTGPNLDELQPDFDTVVGQVTNGGGGMPAFADQLSEQEVRDVAAFVVQSTSGEAAPGGAATTEDAPATTGDDDDDGDGDGDNSGPGGDGDDDDDRSGSNSGYG